MIWAAQLRLTVSGWFGESLAAGSDGADPVGGAEGADGVEGAEGPGDPALLVAGPEDAGHVAEPDGFAWCPGRAAGIDAVAVVIGASADGVPPDGLAAATCRAEPVKLAWVLLPVGVAAQAVAPRAAASTAAAPVTVAILRLGPTPAASFPSRSPGTVGVLMGLLEWTGGSQEYPHNQT